MVSSSGPIALPIVSIQHDFQAVISDVHDGTVPEEDIWLSCYKTGEPSVHGKVRVALGEKAEGGSREVELRSRGGVVLERESRGRFEASCAALAIPPTTIRVPRHIVRDSEADLKTKQITALSVSPDLAQIAIGYVDGTIRRLPLTLSTGARERPPVHPLSYTPHLSGVAISSLRYFPSSRVLLSAGADFALHVLDADPALTTPPAPVRSLKGHVRTVTDAAIVARGRNVLSAAKDGTLRLWDVGGGAQIRVIGSEKYSPINALSVGAKSDGWTPPRPPRPAENGNDAEPPQTQTQTQAAPPDPREVDTADKLVFLALQDGNFECIDLACRTPSVYHSSSAAPESPTRCGAPLSALAYAPRAALVATGSAAGVVAVYDTRALGAPLCAFRRNAAGIEGLAFVAPEDGGGQAGLAVATADGLPYVAGVRPHGPEVRAELAGGGDCEAVRVVLADEGGGGVWVAGDDGVVRMY